MVQGHVLGLGSVESKIVKSTYKCYLREVELIQNFQRVRNSVDAVVETWADTAPAF